jgi:hypothetical protein
MEKPTSGCQDSSILRFLPPLGAVNSSPNHQSQLDGNLPYAISSSTSLPPCGATLRNMLAGVLSAVERTNRPGHDCWPTACLHFQSVQPHADATMHATHFSVSSPGALVSLGRL